MYSTSRFVVGDIMFATAQRGLVATKGGTWVIRDMSHNVPLTERLLSSHDCAAITDCLHSLPMFPSNVSLL